MEPVQPRSGPTWYGNQYPGQQSYQDWPMYDQQSRYDPQPGVNGDGCVQDKNSSSGNAITPISAEISKLLAEFEKRIKYKKVS